ncbi:MAG: hypothetical protein NTX96_02700 [Candidatus Zambryskibacteria bacterium]|nr:hypothetical protein [Candidatus Zambryskibacteria bacterium]
MSDYFDSDFFKFFFGFLTIIFISLIIILAAKIYFSEADLQPVPATNTANQ